MIAGVDFRLFLIRTEGKVIRTGAWNGRVDYSHLPSAAATDACGGPKLTIVQVNRPTNGFEGRSSVALTHALAPEFDAVLHWARDTETFRSIVDELAKSGHELAS